MLDRITENATALAVLVFQMSLVFAAAYVVWALCGGPSLASIVQGIVAFGAKRNWAWAVKASAAQERAEKMRKNWPWG